jgi:hypothetical protein
MTERLEYLEHFLDSVEFVSSGKKGSISNDKWLVSNYQSSFFSIVEKHLKNTDHRVRLETVILLTNVKERSAAPMIKEMRSADNENVSSACLGYLKAVGEDDELIPQLIETLDLKRGQEFRKAAMRLAAVGRREDIKDIRRIYGQVDGEMREDIKKTLLAVIGRHDDLASKKELLLTVPVFPNEKNFISFLNSSEEYLDARYRAKISPRKKISSDTYNNVVRGIKKIRTRMFNESDNLKDYPEELTERYNDLVDLLAWASDDLLKKEVDWNTEPGTVCPKCGSTMVFGNDTWKCIECGHSR